MKLRKILTGAVATIACVAMLSTNVLAATVTPGVSEDGKKLEVVIEGTTGQTTFLALDKDTVLASATGDDIQYIDQDDAASLNIAFAKRADTQTVTYAKQVDLYVGGENITEYSLVKGVYVVADLQVAEGTDLDYTYETSVADFTVAEATEVLAGVQFNYAAIGTTAASAVTFNTTDFTVGTPVAGTGNIYNVPVTYKGVSVDVPVELSAPSPVTSIAVSGAQAINVYVEDDAADNTEAIKAAVKAISGLTVTATRGNGDTFNVTNYDLAVAGDGNSKTVTVSYTTTDGTFTDTTNTIAVTVIEIAPASVQTATGTYTISPDEGTVLDAAGVKAAVEANIASITFAPKYVLNKPNTVEAIPTSNMSFAAELTTDGEEEDVFTVAVTLKEAAGAVEAGTALGTITVTVNYAAKTLITGSVTVQDMTAQVTGDFTDAIPVGAVVIAMPYSDEVMGNVIGMGEDVSAVATVVGADGTFTLEVEPGDYLVLISHIKYVNYGGDVYMSRTVLDAQSMHNVSPSDGETVDLGALKIRYTFFGDLNADGNLNGIDGGFYTQNFNTSIPDVVE